MNPKEINLKAEVDSGIEVENRFNEKVLYKEGENYVVKRGVITYYRNGNWTQAYLRFLKL